MKCTKWCPADISYAMCRLHKTGRKLAKSMRFLLVSVARWAKSKHIMRGARRLVHEQHVKSPFLFCTASATRHIIAGRCSAPRLFIAAAKTKDVCAHEPTFARNSWWTSLLGRSTSTEQRIIRPSTSYRVGWFAAICQIRFSFLYSTCCSAYHRRPAHSRMHHV